MRPVNFSTGNSAHFTHIQSVEIDWKGMIERAWIAGTQDGFASEILLALVVGAIIYFAFFSGGSGGGSSSSGSNDGNSGKTKKKKKRPPEPYTSLEVRTLPAVSSICSTQKCLAAVMIESLWLFILCPHTLSAAVSVLIAQPLSLSASPSLPLRLPLGHWSSVCG
jgi:hypothetical protein